MPAASCIIVYNSKARNGRIKPEYLKKHAEGAGYEVIGVVKVDEPESLETEIKKGLNQAPDQLIIGGGDGTVRTAVEIMAGSATAMYILPIGTANVLAKNLGIPKNIRRALKAGAEGSRGKISLGRANGHIFTVAATIGVSNKVFDNLRPKAKARLGNWAYLTQGVIEFGKHKPFVCRIKTGGGNDFEFDSHQVTVLNGSFAVHEFFTVYPPHDVFEKSLKIHTHAESPNKIHHAANAIREMQKKGMGKYVKTWEIENAEITAKPKQKVALDAEVVTETPLKLEVLPEALNVIIPSTETGNRKQETDRDG